MDGKRRDVARASALAVAALLVLAAALAAWKGDAIVEKVLYLRYGATLGAARFPKPADAAAARRQDLAYLARLPDVDRSFSPAARAAFARRLAGLEARAAALDDARFFLGVAAAVALAGNAHTNVEAVSWRTKLASAPVRLAWFAEGLYVVRARDDAAGLLGARVLAIDGIDPAALVQEAATYFGGTAGHVRAMSPLLLESPEALHALHPGAPAGRLVLRVAIDGRHRTAELPAVPPAQAPPASKPGHLLAPAPLPGEAGRWRTLLAPGPGLPPSLRGRGRSAHAEVLAPGTLYLHLWQIRDDAAGTVAGEMARALGADGDPRWRRIVLDLRFDAGGEYQTVRGELARLGRRLAPGGTLAILTDDTTFSAAIIAAVFARHAAPRRTRVVGTPPGDRLTFWAEGTPAELPRSGIRIGVSTGYHDWLHGCHAWRCYWPNILYSVGDGPLAPDVPVAWSFEDYRRGVDTVLERALALPAGTP